MLTIRNSTISGNTAPHEFGTTNGGGMYLRGAVSVDITHSTIFGNQSAGSIPTGVGLHLTDFTGSTGPSATLRNNIIAGNRYSTSNSATTLGNDCKGDSYVTAASKGAGGGNLIQSGDCSPKLSGDPLLGALTTTGLPYHPLVASSPAIAQGDATICANSLYATDQILGARPQPAGTTCDMGAVEFNQPVTVPAPVASFTVTAITTTAYQFVSTSTGSITSYAWDLGDGSTATDATVNHIYSGPGTYTVTLTVSGPGGTSDPPAQRTITVGSSEPAPVASFVFDHSGVDASFWSTSTGTITSYLWDFGDPASGADNTAHTANADHEFTAFGTVYSVTLTVSGPGGTSFDRQDVGLVALPVASFDWSNPSGSTVQFQMTSPGNINYHDWDFGDGSTSEERNPTHPYRCRGDYRVTLVVRSGVGASAPHSETIRVAGRACPRGARGRSGGGPSATPMPTPTPKPTIFTCEVLNAQGYRVRATHGLRSGVQCRRLDATGVGIQAVINLGFLDAVDVWGYVEQGVEVCFPPERGSGGLMFLDAATAPRTVSPLASVLRDGYTCASINRPGTLVLVSNAPQPSQLPVPTGLPTTLLSGCMVQTNAILNFRDGPAGNVVEPLIPYGVRLTALERTDSWFRVDYHGARGWISAAYVEPQGDCG